MKSLIDYLGCGKYSIRKNKLAAAGDILVIKFSDIVEKTREREPCQGWTFPGFPFIPFLIKYPILGVKYLDFVDFTKDLMKNKSHLSQEGLDQIRKIKVGMNKGR